MTVTLDDRAVPTCADAGGAVAGNRPGRRHGWLVRRRFVLVGYLAPVVVTAALTTRWFRAGRFVAAGDVAPFVRRNLATEWWSLWTHQLSGAGSTSYEAGRGVEVALLALSRAAGLPAWLAQWLLFAGCCALAAWGSAYFAATWCRRPWLVAAAGALGAVNPFQMVSLPNLLPAVAVGTAGLMGGVLLRRARGDSVGARRLVAASLPLSYLSLNPPLVAVVLVWCVGLISTARWGTGRGAARRAGGLAARAVPLGVLVHTWWLLPFAVANVAPAGVAFAAQTDVQGWAWSQARNSLGNVLTLNAHWGWTHSDYFPYATRMDASPLAWLRWVLPGAALLGAVRPPRPLRRPARLLGGFLVGIVLVAKGLHAPGTAANLWLYEHVPGAWLLREPMSKVGPLLVLVETALLVLALDRLIADGRRLTGAHRSRLTRGLVHATAGLLAVAALAYPWPLWTGAVIADQRADLPPAHVMLPSGWFDVAAAVNRGGGAGSVLVLPLDPYYQVTTSWGYHGVDSVPQQLLDRPVLQELPGGYFADVPALSRLLHGVEDALARGDGRGVDRILQALGVSTVVVRHDLVRGVADPAFADYHLLERMMSTVPGARRIVTDDVGSAFRVADSGRVHAYRRLVDLELSAPDLLPLAVAATTAGSAAVARPSGGADGLSWWVSDDAAGEHFVLAARGRYLVTRPVESETSYRATVQRLRGRWWRVVLSDASRVTLDGAVLPALPPLRLPATRARPVALAVGGAIVALVPDASVRLATSQRVALLADSRPALRLAAPDGTGDCDHSAGSPAALWVRTSSTRVWLRAMTHTACAWWDVGAARGGPVLVSVSGSTRTGAPARTCLWRAASARCTQVVTETGGPRQTWLLGDLQGTAHDQLYVYADGGRGGSSAAYTPPVVQPLAEVAATTVSPLEAPPVTRVLDAGEHWLTYAAGVPAAPLQAMSPVEDCDAGIEGGPAELRAEPIPGGVRLSAAADAACAWTASTAPTVAGRYRLSVSYRTLSGEPARLCLWEVGPDRCASVPDLVAPTDRWRTLAVDVVPDPGTRALRLYVYADGQRTPRTVTEYRSISLRPVPLFVLDVAAATGSVERQPAVSGSCAVATCHVRVGALAGRFVLGVSESFAPGWRLTGLPAGWSARHIRLDGYANGWVVVGRGRASLTIRYDPAHLIALAVVASTALAVGLVLGWPLALRLRRTRRFAGRHARRAGRGSARIG